MISIGIVNRFFPPDQAITGRSARELVDFLSRRIPGATITVYATQASYVGGQTDAGESHRAVRRIRSYYQGKHRLLRLAASLHDGARLAWVASRESDVIISLTDPPLLGLWIGLLVRLYRRRWVEWTMDLYPEAFVAARLIRNGGLLWRALRAALRFFSPDAYICLGPQQHNFIQETRGIEVPAVILPCGILESDEGPPPDWRTKHATKVIVAYAGNLGEAHSLDVIEQLVLRIDRERVTFLLAPYGSKAGALRQRLRNVSGIEWRDKVPTGDLSHADVHLASLCAEWTHICVPSKAVSAVCSGRPIVFAGDPDSDNWVLLRDAAWLIPEGSDGIYSMNDIDRVAAELTDRSVLEAKTRAARRIGGHLIELRRAAFERLANVVECIAAGRPCTDEAPASSGGSERWTQGTAPLKARE